MNMPGQSLEPPSRVGNREGWVLGCEHMALCFVCRWLTSHLWVSRLKGQEH